jgi:uncharacterized membrane protein
VDRGGRAVSEDAREGAPPGAAQPGGLSWWQRVYTFRAEDQASHHAGRLIGFTDAILAIAATVLVLELTVRPETPHDTLVNQVHVLAPLLVATFLGFLWITGAWLLSHRQLRQLRAVDHYMTVLVLASSLSICLIPVATAMLAEGYGHADFWVGVEAVSVVILIGNVFSFMSTRYAHRHGLMLGSNADPETRRWALRIWYVVSWMIVLAVIIAPWLPWLALSLVLLTRVSAVLPLGSDRRGYSPATLDE